MDVANFRGHFLTLKGVIYCLDSECVVSLLPVSVFFDEKAAEKEVSKAKIFEKW